ncbi:PREDICTED: disks large-associated protein 5 isoform X2 [Wasmannia auropunctata]|uniref:disks large-associated protein 5 isoform X2 n=1 Tax=Wasmannia auropunctata TaxID=64793 RepID=UPI0005EE13E2|nr:PREDICTED: disks large-associated protein 5 isoform X2 [Wasmannia auropunctata]
MTDFKQHYKNPRPGFGDVDHRRYLRAFNHDKSRREVRTRTFDNNRNLQDVSAPTSPQPAKDVSTVADDRMKKLIRWKEERNRKKKLEAALKKPAFRVGVVHHSLCSPRIRSDTVVTAKKIPKKTEKSNITRKPLTRATEKRLLEKIASENLKSSTHSTSLNKQNSSQKLNKSIIRESDELTTTKTTRSSLKEQAKNQTSIQDSLQEEKSSSSSSDIDMKTSPKTPTSSEKENCNMEDLIIFSPYLTRSRGKRNSRKEGQQRLGIGRRSEEIPTKETVMKNLNICVEEEERTAQYFKYLVNKETDRLKEICKKWLDIGSENDIPEEAKYEIQQAVGQTNLLLNKKFERFRGLVQDCETGKGEMLVTCRDLQGFWDMTYMEIKDCDARFEKLEHRQSNGWQEEEHAVVKRAVKKRMPVKRQIVSSKPSALKSLIQAARKNKMEAGTLSKEVLLPQDIHINEKPIKKEAFVELDENTDNRRSARRSKSHELTESKLTPARGESFKAISVQKVHSSSDKFKRMKSPFAVMKISQKCKTPEVQLDDTISYVNSDQTPGKSILKKSEELETKEARMKSAHKVNFDDRVVSTEVPLDEEIQTQLNLSAALNRIDNFDSMETINPLLTPHINAEKRLDFEIEDTYSSDDLSQLNLTINTKIKKRYKSKSSIRNTSDAIVQPLNDITSSVPMKELSPNNVKITSRKSLKNLIQHKDTPSRKNNILFSPTTGADKIITETISKDMEELDLGMRILRNRTVPANNTPKSSRTSKTMTPKRTNVNKEENKTPRKLRKSSSKLSQKNENEYMTENGRNIIETVTLVDNIKKRSLRKSVTFDATCVACAENKPTLPMTPYSRRSKTLSRQSQSKDALDLMSWDTPDRKHQRRRTTRSHSNNS